VIAATAKLQQRFLARVVLVTSLALAMPFALRAQSTATPAPTAKLDKMAKPDTHTDGASERSGSARSVAVKRQKLHECGIKWQDEKKVNGLTGKAAYLKFLSACMKG
jgi:hypothetical protein